MVDVKETPATFGRHEHLVGILSEPAEPVPDVPAVVLLNAGIIHRVGPSRLSVDAARRLAAAGYRTLRFDLSGIGDSGSAGREPLDDVVRRDILDAVDVASGSDGREVVLLGLCSGADNAFHVGAADDRVRGLVLIDPRIHPTPSFRARRIFERLRSASSWRNLLTGRSLSRRLRPREPKVRPAYYGLLTCSAEEARERAAAMSSRGVHFLYILTGGVNGYCNYPEQVQDSMPGIFNGNLRTEWRPEADHLLSRAADREWFQATVLEWLRTAVGPGAIMPPSPAAGSIRDEPVRPGA
jgi:pimeloyl-ACP methyl ester carboxylesterase